MKFKDQFRFVRQNMKKNKVRVFMTVLATAIGCAFLIVLASVGFGLQQSIVKDMLEQRAVTQIDIYGKEEDKGSFSQIKNEDVDYFESIDNVKAVTRRQRLNQEPVYKIGDYNTGASTYVAYFPAEMKAGLELSAGRLPEKANEIVVGYNFVESLYSTTAPPNDIRDESGNIKEEYKYNDDLVGKNIDMKVTQLNEGKEESSTITLQIVGITKKPTREWARDQTVFISESVMKEIEAFTGTPRGMVKPPNDDIQMPEQDPNAYDEVKIYANNLEAVDGIINQLDLNDYASYSVVSEMKQINTVFTIAKSGLIFIGTIALLIASIGIYNTMTMAVTERAPDIGIMKAIGANPRVIKRIFLLESSYIGLIGALIGTVVAYLISIAVNIAIPFIIESAFGEELPETLQFSAIPLSLVLIAVGICLVVTILSGLRPARKATKMDVLKAMRREI
ncbi:ABC transporter permease [Terrihalobacillus insolitus]|uniref:ABC transporter permease n=1 Tax=Terrihalobacillus insolitus TaxID=2950438 RepID=UPI00233FC626|nr:ABC transporter permease [Terrihalobacillus insolitus]MDC3413144.1 ABC transporter permease [Terrihalobacillus insolitus]